MDLRNRWRAIPNNVYEDALAFVALGEEGEEHLHLGAVLLDVAEVVEDDGVEAIEALELSLEEEIAAGDEQPLDKRVGRREQDPVAALDQLVADGADDVTLAAAWQAEGEHVLGAIDEGTVTQRGQDAADFDGELLELQGGQRLVHGQLGGLVGPLDAPLTAFLGLDFGQRPEVLAEAPALLLGAQGEGLVVVDEARQLQGAQQPGEGRRRRHATPPRSWS